MSSQTINVQTQLNKDGSLQYLKYKYKGSIVKVDFGFDQNGQLLTVAIPQFLNIPHVKVFEIISGMFIQSLLNVQNIVAGFAVKGGILEIGSIVSAVGYATVASHVVTNLKTFQLGKVMISASKAAWIKYRWNGIDISAERNPDDKTMVIEHFPLDYYAMVGDGVRAFDVQARWDSVAGTITVEIVGEEY